MTPAGLYEGCADQSAAAAPPSPPMSVFSWSESHWLVCDCELEPESLAQPDTARASSNSSTPAFLNVKHDADIFMVSPPVYAFNLQAVQYIPTAAMKAAGRSPYKWFS
jgi:hypothetical protein